MWVGSVHVKQFQIFDGSHVAQPWVGSAVQSLVLTHYGTAAGHVELVGGQAAVVVGLSNRSCITERKKHPAGTFPSTFPISRFRQHKQWCCGWSLPIEMVSHSPRRLRPPWLPGPGTLRTAWAWWGCSPGSPAPTGRCRRGRGTASRGGYMRGMQVWVRGACRRGNGTAAAACSTEGTTRSKWLATSAAHAGMLSALQSTGCMLQGKACGVQRGAFSIHSAEERQKPP